MFFEVTFNLATVMGLVWLGLFLLLLALFLVDLLQDEELVPHFVKAAIRHGKLIEKNLLGVPKKCFTHFYFTGSIVNITITVLLLSKIDENPKHSKYLNLFGYFGLSSNTCIDRDTGLLIIILMAVHNLRRLYESYCITVFSTTSISIFHYLLGHFMYCTFHVSILSQTNFFTHAGPNVRSFRSLGIGLFLFGSYLQHSTAVQLARLRQNSRGAVKTYGYFIPKDGLFIFISSPHYFAEMLIFFSFLVTSGFRHLVLWAIVMVVILIQVISGYFVHNWYLNKFPGYKDLKRRAVIPFVF